MKTIEIEGGFLVPDDQLMSKWQLETGKLDHDAFLIPLAVSNIPDPSGIVFDIGAMAGDHTIAYAKKVGEAGGMVIAIEAGKDAFDCLVHNAEKFEGKVICLNAAVGDNHGGMARHTVNAVNVGGSTVSGEENTEVASNEIRTITIDGFCEDSEINSGTKPVTFIKVDVEGYELMVLKGAINTLRKYRPVLLMEFNSFRLAENGASYKDIYDFLLAENYSWRIVQPECKGGDSQYDCLCWPNAVVAARKLPGDMTAR